MLSTPSRVPQTLCCFTFAARSDRQWLFHRCLKHQEASIPAAPGSWLGAVRVVAKLLFWVPWHICDDGFVAY